MANWRTHRWLQVTFGLVLTVAAIDLLLPPDMRRYEDRSLVVTAANGQPLRTYLTRDGKVRMVIRPNQVNPSYLRLLKAYEDQRFDQHWGVDPLALGRALRQALRAGRVVSGGSTLTMQTARLLEPRPRSLGAKLIEILRALQLERRYSKDDILGMYLTLAPFGGNLEGVRSASLAYWGKEPKDLTVPEAAVLVALPQAPSRIRKDLSGGQARAARAKVLRVAGPRIGLSPREIAKSQSEPVRLVQRTLPFRAPHLADRLRARIAVRADQIATTIDAPLQAALETRAPGWSRQLDPRASLGVLVVDNRTRHVRAYLGSAGFFNNDRAGQVDAVTAIRSPGSTLKPFLYAFAFDKGLAHPMTLVDDVETRFGAYTPVNFRSDYHGRVTLADALRQSLNVPAVLLMDRLGPVFVVERLRRAGLDLRLPDGVTPGLPIALGGVGVRLENLTAGYAALATDAIIQPLRFTPRMTPAFAGDGVPLVERQAQGWTTAILRTAPRPDGVPIAGAAQSGAIAVKTGTSYGFRDAWAFGYDAQHTVGVWTGRPDGSPSPGRFGIATAAPLLFEVFDILGVADPGSVADIAPAGPLPPGQALLARGDIRADGARRLRLRFPVDGATVAYATDKAIPLEALGGTRPYIWMINNGVYGQSATGQALMWRPDGLGFHDITVIDGAGQSATARVRLTSTIVLMR